jgi:hypothetical protein
MTVHFNEESKQLMRSVFSVLFMNEIRPPYQQSRMDYKRLSTETNLSSRKVDQAITELCTCGYARIHLDNTRSRRKVVILPTALGLQRYQNFVAGL